MILNWFIIHVSFIRYSHVDKVWMIPYTSMQHWIFLRPTRALRQRCNPPPTRTFRISATEEADAMSSSRRAIRLRSSVVSRRLSSLHGLSLNSSFMHFILIIIRFLVVVICICVILTMSLISLLILLTFQLILYKYLVLSFCLSFVFNIPKGCF